MDAKEERRGSYGDVDDDDRRVGVLFGSEMG